MVILLLLLLLAPPPPVQVLALRLGPEKELKAELRAFAQQHAIQAGVIVTCVGSLSSARLRFADRSEAQALQGPFEIVSLVGTLSPDGDHLHISLSDADGRTLGGHLVEGRVYTTAEIAIGVLPMRFTRVKDPATGYPELKIEP